jgi:hypothetical protein
LCYCDRRALESYCSSPNISLSSRPWQYLFPKRASWSDDDWSLHLCKWSKPVRSSPRVGAILFCGKVLFAINKWAALWVRMIPCRYCFRGFQRRIFGMQTRASPQASGDLAPTSNEANESLLSKDWFKASLSAFSFLLALATRYFYQERRCQKHALFPSLAQGDKYQTTKCPFNHQAHRCKEMNPLDDCEQGIRDSHRLETATSSSVKILRIPCYILVGRL